MFENKKIHMIGIGGISMSGIAEILLTFNCKITGFDAQESDITKKLIKNGVDVNYDINLENVKNADIVVYTAAIKEDHEELVFARSNNIETYERSKFLGLLMKEYKNVICISGTHGKSTTTGMISEVFLKAGLNPTIQIGAILPIIHGNFYVGNKDFFIAESCEYHDSFLDFYPTCEGILNIDDDHLDYFKNLDNIISSFRKSTDNISKDGYLIVNNDNLNALKACSGKNYVTYGIENESNYMAKNIQNIDGLYEYDLYIDGENKGTVELGVRGMHNVYNSLCAIAICHKYINDLVLIKDAIGDYHGVNRRFEYLGKYKGAFVYDDYAHHPSEIKTTVESVKSVKHNKDYAIFMPHTYSRTKDHLKEFAEVLSKFDNVIIAPIYAARESNIYGVKEEDLVTLIKKNNTNAIFLDTNEKMEKYLNDNIKENDLIISIGAGPIDKFTKCLVNKNE